jgi:hypothetical protein
MAIARSSKEKTTPRSKSVSTINVEQSVEALLELCVLIVTKGIGIAWRECSTKVYQHSGLRRKKKMEILRNFEKIIFPYF